MRKICSCGTIRKQNYYLITVKGEKRVNLKSFSEGAGDAEFKLCVSRGSDGALGLILGAVTPLGVLNDETRSVKVFLDQDFLQEPGLVGVHPNENTATVWLKAEDLIWIIPGARE